MLAHSICHMSANKQLGGRNVRVGKQRLRYHTGPWTLASCAWSAAGIHTTDTRHAHPVRTAVCTHAHAREGDMSLECYVCMTYDIQLYSCIWSCTYELIRTAELVLNYLLNYILRSTIFHITTNVAQL